MKAYYTIVGFITLACLYGWGANLVKLIAGIDDPITALFLMRIVGVFAAPLGVILGYF